MTSQTCSLSTIQIPRHSLPSAYSRIFPVDYFLSKTVRRKMTFKIMEPGFLLFAVSLTADNEGFRKSVNRVN
jgi:hypothetical protein